MMGTLAAELAGKKIKTFSSLFQAMVTGDIEEVNGILKITRINVDYSLKLSGEKHSDANTAFDIYLTKCPGAQSVVGCINITHYLKFIDED